MHTENRARRMRASNASSMRCCTVGRPSFGGWRSCGVRRHWQCGCAAPQWPWLVPVVPTALAVGTVVVVWHTCVLAAGRCPTRRSSGRASGTPLTSTLCMKGNSGMARGSRSRDTAVLHVVVRRWYGMAGPSAGLPSSGRWCLAAGGSAKARACATAAVSCTTRRSSGRAFGAPLS
jgi:hypothetical protein